MPIKLPPPKTPLMEQLGCALHLDHQSWLLVDNFLATPAPLAIPIVAPAVASDMTPFPLLTLASTTNTTPGSQCFQHLERFGIWKDELAEPKKIEEVMELAPLPPQPSTPSSSIPSAEVDTTSALSANTSSSQSLVTSERFGFSNPIVAAFEKIDVEQVWTPLPFQRLQAQSFKTVQRFGFADHLIAQFECLDDAGIPPLVEEEMDYCWENGK